MRFFFLSLQLFLIRENYFHQNIHLFNSFIYYFNNAPQIKQKLNTLLFLLIAEDIYVLSINSKVFYFIFIFISESIYVLSILQSLTLFYIFNIEILSHTKGVCICIFESFQVFKLPFVII